MRGLTDEERRFMQDVLAAGTIHGHNAESLISGLIASGRMAALPENANFTYITPAGKLALELDTLARSGKVEV